MPQMVPWIGMEEAAQVCQAIEENWITEGPRGERFLERLKALTGSPYAVLAPNGTLAIYLAMIAVGIEPGDHVLVPDCTFIGSATAVLMAGAIPVFVDINPRTFQIDLNHAEDFLTPKTAAVMPVHLFGMSTDMETVNRFAQRHGLRVIEDAAQGIGVRYRGSHVGTLGDVGCFSFFADKTITTGEGGMVVCKDEGTYERLQLLRNQGRLDRGSFVHPAVGYNFRMTDLQTAVGLAQLDRLGQIIENKQQIIAWYHTELDGLDPVSFLQVEPHSSYVPFRCVLQCEAATELMAFLEGRGIQPRQNFYPLHRQPCFADLRNPSVAALKFQDGMYPNAIEAYEQGVLLPCYPTMTKSQVQYIGRVIKEFYNAGWHRYTTNITTSSIPRRTIAAK